MPPPRGRGPSVGCNFLFVGLWGRWSFKMGTSYAKRATPQSKSDAVAGAGCWGGLPGRQAVREVDGWCPVGRVVVVVVEMVCGQLCGLATSS
jgi:hypothetical protein